MRTSKCRVLPFTLPDIPTRPICCPAVTLSFTLTDTSDNCEYKVNTGSRDSRQVVLNYYQVAIGIRRQAVVLAAVISGDHDRAIRRSDDRCAGRVEEIYAVMAVLGKCLNIP